MPIHTAILVLLAFWCCYPLQEDRKQLAEKALAEGKQLEAQRTSDSLRKALGSYEHALSLWRSLEDRQAEAETLDHIGTVYFFLSQGQKALEAFQQELAIWRSAGGHPKETADVLNNIGIVYEAVGLPQKSFESYQDALALYRTAGDRKGAAKQLGNIGLYYLSVGEPQKALDLFNEALPVFRELYERADLADILNNIGGVYLTWSDYRKALAYFGQALELRRALGQRRAEAIGLNNIGRTYDLLGEAQKALDYHRQALDLRRTMGDRVGEAGSLNNIGLVYGSLGDTEKALDSYKQALAIFRETSDRNGEASALNNIAFYFFNAKGDANTALEYHRQALEIRRALGHKIGEADQLVNIGNIYNKLNDPRKALGYNRQALEMKRALGHRFGEAVALTNLGATHALMGESEIALDYFGQSLGLHRTLGTRTQEPVPLYGIAQVERDRGNLVQARSRIEEAINVIESLRGKVASQDLRASFVARQEDYYDFFTDLLMRLHRREPSSGYDRAALQASERAHARSLVELLAESRIDVNQGVSPELKQREREVNSRIAWAQSQLINAYSQANRDQEKISTLEYELKRVDGQREQLSAEIRQKHPGYAELRYPAPLDLKAIQSILDERTLLLEYVLGKDGSYLFAASRSDFLAAALPPASTIAEQVQALRAIINSPPQRSTLAKQIENSRQLYRELIEPAAKLMAGKRKLIIVPSGVLHYLPFEALLSSGEARTLTTLAATVWPYLVRDYAISYVPSAGVLASLRSRPIEKSGSRKTFLAFADPVYEDETQARASVARSSVRGAFGAERSWKLERLIESRREVEQIAGLYPRDQISLLLGEQATEENVKAAGRLSEYRFVHFATHGLLNEERPAYSGLILSLPSMAAGNNAQSTIRNPQSEDGLLQVYEVFNLKLNADLVVLSACETGLGKEMKGEGLIGLTRAFLYAGTPSVMVSSWSVQDRSTADLMVKFYQELNRSQDKAEALRQAKLKLIQNSRYAAPYYWAPFILIGEQH